MTDQHNGKLTKRENSEVTGNEEASLISVAKTLGRAAGRLAVRTGLDHPAPPAPNKAKGAKPGKLVSKNKTRVPRREKKASQKSAGRRISG